MRTVSFGSSIATQTACEGDADRPAANRDCPLASCDGSIR
jgi:hypothetical protein